MTAKELLQRMTLFKARATAIEQSVQTVIVLSDITDLTIGGTDPGTGTYLEVES